MNTLGNIILGNEVLGGGLPTVVVVNNNWNIIDKATPNWNNQNKATPNWSKVSKDNTNWSIIAKDNPN